MIELKVKDFSLEQTLECGQCFHFKKLSDGSYVTVHKDKAVRCAQEDDVLKLFNAETEEDAAFWSDYFDLDNDYAGIKSRLCSCDDKMPEIICDCGGIHLLRQGFFETLISFIISQDKQIPHIKQIVAAISKAHGKYLGTFDAEDFYSFPDANTLSNVSEDELRALKTGFRAPYIKDAVDKAASGIITEEKLLAMTYEEKMETLKTIKGIGDKVANCVILYSLGDREAFPVDVWIKRITEHVYFDDKDTDKKVIMQFAADRYGQLGGYAQQYMFYFGRNLKKLSESQKQRKTEK